jgi:hypothetical protein
MPVDAETVDERIGPARASGEQRNIPHPREQVNRDPPIGTSGYDLCVTGGLRQRGAGGERTTLQRLQSALRVVSAALILLCLFAS